MNIELEQSVGGKYFNDRTYNLLKEVFFVKQTPSFCVNLGWEPAADVFETDISVFIRLDLAGVKKENIKIIFDEGSLHISGKRTEYCRSDKVTVSRMEISYGQFEKIINLKCPVNVEKAKAIYNNGFLEIDIPKNNDQILVKVAISIS